MREIALHLLDLAQNSIMAGARQVDIGLALDEAGLLTLSLVDDGWGMDARTLEAAQSPFGTSRVTRKLGFGIPLTREHAEATGGRFRMDSMPGIGTRVEAAFNTRHIDCQPLGKLADTLLSLVLANPETPDFRVTLSAPGKREALDTRDIKMVLSPVPINQPEAALWLRGCLETMTENCFGGNGL